MTNQEVKGSNRLQPTVFFVIPCYNEENAGPDISKPFTSYISPPTERMVDLQDSWIFSPYTVCLK